MLVAYIQVEIFWLPEKLGVPFCFTQSVICYDETEIMRSSSTADSF